MRIRSFFAVLTLAVLFTAPFGVQMNAQEPTKVTLETMNDPSFRQAASLPQTWWLADNTAIIYDTRKPDSLRGLERLDPATGKRTALLNWSAATASFAKLFTEGKPPRLSPVPSAFTSSGKYGLYVISGDIFVLDIPNAAFIRLTNTPEEEKSVEFSPDGTKLAFVRGKNLFACDIAAKKEWQLTSDGSETILNGTLSWVYWEEIFGRRDIGYWWSGDSKAIAYLQTDESEVSIQHYVNIDPWTPTVRTQRYPKVGEKNPAVRVGVVELGSPQTTWAAVDRGSFEYVIRVGWLPDNKRFFVETENRLQTQFDLYFVDRQSGNAQFILKDTDEGWMNMSEDLYFLKDGKHFLMASERDGYDHLYRFTMKGELVNKVTNGDWAMCSSGGGAFWIKRAVTGIDEGGEWVYFTSLEKSSVERHLYRVRFDGKKMERLTTGDGTHSITMSPDAKFYFDRFSTISTPPSLTLCDAKGKVKTTLATPEYAGFKKFGIQFAELVWIPARDGFNLPASITKPRDFDPKKKYPVVVEVYGGPSAPTVSNSFQFGAVWDNVLGNNGYICVKIDNRAATAISKKLENLLLYRSPGEIELNDLVDGVRWLKQLPYVDPDRIGLTGWSGGGTNTVLGMTRSSEFKAGIAGGTVTDFRFYDSKWGEALMKTEKENLKGFEENSLLKYAKDLHGKLLLVHGLHDDNVHIQNIWRFINELIKANKLFELMVYPLRGHGVGDPAGSKHLRNLELDFWKRNL
jgi:dipeptidyl-peptidase 4